MQKSHSGKSLKWSIKCSGVKVQHVTPKCSGVEVKKSSRKLKYRYLRIVLKYSTWTTLFYIPSFWDQLGKNTYRSIPKKYGSVILICIDMLLVKHELLHLAACWRLQEFSLHSMHTAQLSKTATVCGAWHSELIFSRYTGFIAVVCDRDHKPSILLYHQWYISHLSAAICALAHVLNPSSVSTLPLSRGCDRGWQRT